MGKHSEEKKKINKKVIIVIMILCVIILAVIVGFLVKNKNWFNAKSNTSIENIKTIENERLVLKNNSDYNKIIEFDFEDNKVKTIKIYEQFEEKEKYEEKKNTYKITQDINLIEANDKKLSIEIERKNLGSDEGLSYEQVYDKYINQLIDIYTVIK